ncbi:MAG: hypothetical protein HY290_13685 [Planctomycetia bacterium]|nr:hypothetical protein [Planctomycetia bacterium]
MKRILLWLVCVICGAAAGCSSEPGSVEKASLERPVSSDKSSADEVPPQSEPPLEEPETPAANELKLSDSGITFVVPESWKRVKPDTNIIEAEFELPRMEDDEYDGRLTLMSSLGNREEMISRRTAEFKFEPGETPTQETLSIGGIDATIVDLRGEWKGPDFRAPSSRGEGYPRPGYRMLYVVVPFGENSSFFAKLTGPRATIAAHEDEFREFLKSAKISR